ncbi:MAG: HEAT repeat domain-containing protein [Candidatus Riflebacteria bacterium]|nr:HEAT repeat domain-containing protein [Candidatus Riflebacteria bacterium]
MTPEKLKEFQRDLMAPVRSFRLFAIETAIRDGSGRELLALLEKTFEAEQDEECQILLKHAITVVQKRLEPAREESITLPVVDFIKQWSGSNSETRMFMLENLSQQTIVALASHAPEILSEESHPVVAASLIRKFGTMWPTERLKSLEARLNAPSLSLRLAALEALTQSAPKLLVANLPRLLSTEDPRMRAMAIRGLARLSPEEALLQLEQMLLRGDSGQRQAAIQCAFYLPFEEVKPVLLAYIGMETDPDLLDRVGQILAANPDTQTPFQLYQTMDKASPEKKEILKNILDLTLKMLKDSQFLGNDFAAYQDQLHNWGNQQAALRIVQECLDRLGDGDETTIDPSLEPFVLEQMSYPLVREVFNEALEWPLGKSVRAMIRHWLEQPSSVSSIPVTQPAESFEKMAPDECIRFLARFEQADLIQRPSFLSDLWKNRYISNDLRATLLRTAARLMVSLPLNDVESITNRDDINLVAAALEYLGAIEPSRVFPRLENFLQSPQIRLKVAALRILKRLDITRAIASLKALLESPNPEKNRTALACLIYFDFAMIRSMVADFISSGPSERLFESAICLFDANPDPDNLHVLFSIEQSLDKKRQDEIRELRRRQSEQLLNAGVITKEILLLRENEFTRRWNASREMVGNMQLISSDPHKIAGISNQEDTNNSFWLLKVALLASFILGILIFLIGKAL